MADETKETGTELPDVKESSKAKAEFDDTEDKYFEEEIQQEEKPEKKGEEVKEEAPEEKKVEKPSAKKQEKEEKKEEKKEEEGALIFALRTTANREDQVMDFVTSNITKKGLNVYSVVRPHGMRGYIFLEAASRIDAEHAVHGIPYARGILPKSIDYSEMEHMVEPVKREISIRKNDIVEIISGPFKRETAKISRIDEQKEEVVVELVEAAVPIPITLKVDAVKVIRRDTEEDDS